MIFTWTSKSAVAEKVAFCIGCAACCLVSFASFASAQQQVDNQNRYYYYYYEGDQASLVAPADNDAYYRGQYRVPAPAANSANIASLGVQPQIQYVRLPDGRIVAVMPTETAAQIAPQRAPQMAARVVAPTAPTQPSLRQALPLQPAAPAPGMVYSYPAYQDNDELYYGYDTGIAQQQYYDPYPADTAPYVPVPADNDSNYSQADDFRFEFYDYQ